MDLGRLIDTHRGARTYIELSRDCGGTPSDKRLQQLVTKPMKAFPDPDTVRALAKGLKLSQSAIVLAAAESLGLDVSRGTPRLVELLPAGAAALTEEQAGAIAHLVATMVTAIPEPGVVATEQPKKPAHLDVSNHPVDAPAGTWISGTYGLGKATSWANLFGDRETKDKFIVLFRTELERQGRRDISEADIEAAMATMFDREAHPELYDDAEVDDGVYLPQAARTTGRAPSARRSDDEERAAELGAGVVAEALREKERRGLQNGDEATDEQDIG